jgi:hypothetical protein
MLFQLFTGCVSALSMSSKHNVIFASFLSVTTAPAFNCTCAVTHEFASQKRKTRFSFVIPHLDWLWGPPVWLILVVEWLVCDTDHILIFGTEVNNAWGCTATLQDSFMAWKLIDHRTSFYIFKGFYDIHVHALIVKFQKYTNKCTILQYTFFTVKTPGLQHVSILSRGIRIMKANEMHCFSNLFDKSLYMFQTSPLTIIRSISTMYTQQ